LIDEQRLLAGVRKLDPEALSQAHDAYYPAIFRYIAFRVGNQQVAEDLTSEVFTRLLRAVRDRSAPDNTLRGWLYRVASFVVADYHRQGYRVEHTTLNETIEAKTADPADAISNRQTLDELYEALAELTRDQQDVIALRFGYEMPIRDVAQTMGKSEGAVKQLQARAIAALSRKLSPRMVS
jgi:RNA polymerase sigma-70 factor (ECF subfamily)